MNWNRKNLPSILCWDRRWESRRQCRQFVVGCEILSLSAVLTALFLNMRDYSLGRISTLSVVYQFPGHTNLFCYSPLHHHQHVWDLRQKERRICSQGSLNASVYICDEHLWWGWLTHSTRTAENNRRYQKGKGTRWWVMVNERRNTKVYCSLVFYPFGSNIHLLPQTIPHVPCTHTQRHSHYTFISHAFPFSQSVSSVLSPNRRDSYDDKVGIVCNISLFGRSVCESFF